MFGLTGFISCIIIFSVQPSYGSEIIGGEVVKPHSMPFMALLESSKPNCGGILIHQSWVLTAAHCNKKDVLPIALPGSIGWIPTYGSSFVPEQDTSLCVLPFRTKTVLLGVHSIKSKENERRSRQVRKVQKYFPHPGYNKTTRLHDLMLLKLDKPVAKTESVEWLQLGKTVKYPKAGTICVVAGWGRINYKVKGMSDVLMSVQVPVIDRKKCNSSKHYNGRPSITDSMVCAGTNKADTCAGDSGGPLLVKGVLVGVTSFGGKECGTSKLPGVYTFLTPEHLVWIKNVMMS